MTRFGSLDRVPDKDGKKHMFYSQLRWLYNLENMKEKDPETYAATRLVIQQVPANLRPISEDPVAVLQDLVEKVEIYYRSLLLEKAGKRKRATVA